MLKNAKKYKLGYGLWACAAFLGSHLAMAIPLKAEGLPGLSPLYGLQGLVAGGLPVLAGANADGAFDQARFGEPRGLLFDPLRERLWVADAGLGALRGVELGNRNQVQTLGRGIPFDFAGSTLVRPWALAWIKPGELMAVLDSGAPAILVMDMKQGKLVERWQPSDDATRNLLANGSDIEAGQDWVLIAGRTRPNLGALAWSAGHLQLRQTWDVQGLPEGGIRSLRVENQAFVIAGDDSKPQIFRITPVGTTLPGGFPAATVPLPLTLSAEVMPQPAIQPAAFVKDGGILDVFCAGTTQVAHVNPENMAMEGLPIYSTDDRIVGVDKPLVQNRWVDQPAAAAADRESRTWYISDPWNRRIVFYRQIQSANRDFDAGNSLGYHAYEYPKTHRSFLRRVVLNGLSICFYPPDTRSRSHGLTQRLESHLNQLSCMRGAGKGYEAIFAGGNMAFGYDGENRLGQLRHAWKKMIDECGPDVFVQVVIPNDLFLSLVGYAQHRLDPDGLPKAEFDPEEALSGMDDGFRPKAYRALEALLRSKPYKANGLLTPDGHGIFIHHERSAAVAALSIEDPQVRFLCWQLFQPYLKDLARKAEDARGSMGHPLKVVLVYLPTPGVVSHEEGYHDPASVDGTEFGRLLDGAAKDLGFDFIDLCAYARAATASTPGFYNKDHMNSMGADAMAAALAQRLFDSVPQGQQP